jgi:DNA polymerase III delta prime subunit
MQVTSGRKQLPPRILIYGVPGCGKSTLASKAARPLFIDCEQGTSNLDVDRVEPADFAGVLSTIRDASSEQHEYRTLVIDTLDAVEGMIWKVVTEEYNRTAKVRVGSAQEIPFARGMDAAVEHWRQVVAELERAWGRGMSIVLLDHSTIRTFKDPTTEDYQRIEPKIDRKASALVRSWCDAVLFADYRVEVDVSATTKRAKGHSIGERVIRTEYRASFDAKNRYGLPAEMQMDWAALATAIKAGMQPKEIVQ